MQRPNPSMTQTEIQQRPCRLPLCLLVLGALLLAVPASASDLVQSRHCQSQIIKLASKYWSCTAKAAIRSSSSGEATSSGCATKFERQVSKLRSRWFGSNCPTLEALEAGGVSFSEMLAERSEELTNTLGLREDFLSDDVAACSRAMAGAVAHDLSRRTLNKATQVYHGRSRKWWKNLDAKLSMKVDSIRRRHGDACNGVGLPVDTAILLNEAIAADVSAHSNPSLLKWGPTDVTTQLNRSIRGSGKSGRAGTYDQSYSNSSGFGVLIRNLNDGQPAPLDDFAVTEVNENGTPLLGGDSGETQGFIVSSMWHNDMNVPNSIYPYNEMLTPSGVPCSSYNPPSCSLWGTNINEIERDQKTGHWMTPTLVAVYDLDPNTPLTTNGTKWNIEPFPQANGAGTMATSKTDANWGYGVLYGHDANAEKRAFPIFKTWSGGNPVLTDYHYSAPGAVTTNPTDNAAWTADPTSYGASANLAVGNPQANGSQGTGEQPTYGAGAGVHVRYNYADAKKNNGNSWDSEGGTDTHSYATGNLLWRQDSYSGYWGEANYALKNAKSGAQDNSWEQLTDKLADAKNHWTKGPDGQKAPFQWILDIVVPWVNNWKDMVNINNALYRDRASLFGNSSNGHSGIPDSGWWGWTEVPIDPQHQTQINQPGVGAVAFALVLPQGSQNISQFVNKKNQNCAVPCPYKSVGRQLQWYSDKGFIANGSTILVARMLKQQGQFYREFVLQNFSVTYSGKTYTVQRGSLTVK